MPIASSRLPATECGRLVRQGETAGLGIGLALRTWSSATISRSSRNPAARSPMPRQRLELCDDGLERRDPGARFELDHHVPRRKSRLRFHSWATSRRRQSALVIGEVSCGAIREHALVTATPSRADRTRGELRCRTADTASSVQPSCYQERSLRAPLDLPATLLDLGRDHASSGTCSPPTIDHVDGAVTSRRLQVWLWREAIRNLKRSNRFVRAITTA